MNNRLLTTYSRISTHRNSPRLWLETRRLEQLGFNPGTSIEVEQTGPRLKLRASRSHTEHHVSSRKIAGTIRPIIDINSDRLLSQLVGFENFRVLGYNGLIEISPSVRAFRIARSRLVKPPYRVLELFAGGGTLTAAATGNPHYQVVAGLEIEPEYADVWQEAHPEAELIQADVRDVHPNEVPEFDIVLAGIPCTSHSTIGRAKKNLAGKPELGDTGDLFVPTLNIILQKCPTAILFENVPSFGTSIAGQLVTSTLAKAGYSVTETILEPNSQWGEPSDRRRWVMIATLKGPCTIVPPMKTFDGTIAGLLDAPNPDQDKADCERIAGTIAGLRAHNARHAAMGHGFSFSTINGSENCIPTIVKAYHKINMGPFVKCPYGLRLLRQSEIERIQGSQVKAGSYKTAVEILGQGVQTRVMREILRQLASHLNGDHKPTAEAEASRNWNKNITATQLMLV